MRFHRLLILLFVPLYFFSCTPQQRMPNYLEHITDSTGKGIVNIPEMRIQKGDLLSIQISSLSTKPELSDVIYNQISVITPNSNNVTTTGYLVDANGDLEHHRLGIIHAEGMTKKLLADEIKKRLTVPVELLANPTVIIRFLNFKVSVLGAVSRPGTITVPGERLTILEAIGLAGDITQFGKKNNVRIIRELNGIRETGLIDLSTDKLFDSQFYNLAQNDIVMVEPNDKQQKQAEQAEVAQKMSLALSVATIALSIYGIFRGN